MGRYRDGTMSECVCVCVVLVGGTKEKKSSNREQDESKGNQKLE